MRKTVSIRKSWKNVLLGMTVTATLSCWSAVAFAAPAKGIAVRPDLAAGSGLAEPSISGQSSPAARTIDTARFLEKSFEITRGTKVNDARWEAVKRHVIRSWLDGSLQELPVFARSGGEIIVPLGHVLPILQTSPGNFSVVILGRGVKPMSLAGAPAAEWVVHTTYAESRPVLEIMPRFTGLRGSVQIVATSPHGYPLIYTIGLASDKAKFTPVLSFYRIPHIPSPSPQEVAALEAVKALAPIANATQVNTDWRVRCLAGDCSKIRPVSVMSSRTATFIHLPTGKSPMVLVRDKSGKSLLVHSRMSGDTLVVGSVPYRIDLITGAWNHLAEIHITNESGE